MGWQSEENAKMLGAESAETLPLVMPGLLFRVPFRHDTSEHNSKARPILK